MFVDDCVLDLTCPPHIQFTKIPDSDQIHGPNH